MTIVEGRVPFDYPGDLSWTHVHVVDDIKDIGNWISGATKLIHGRIQDGARKRVHHGANVEAEEKASAHPSDAAATFIGNSVQYLRSRESTERRISNAWYFLGCMTLMIGVGVGYWRMMNLGIHSKGTLQAVEFWVMGLAVVGLLVGASKYAFVLGGIHAIEAIRHAERAHAISFGEFYLRSFARSLNWDEVRAVFDKWNLETRGPERVGTSEIDPKILDAVTAIAQALTRGAGDSGSRDGTARRGEVAAREQVSSLGGPPTPGR